jgi:hypothetical protein
MDDIFILLPARVGLDISAFGLLCFYMYIFWGHPIYSRHNAKFFLGLTGSNFIGGVILQNYLFKYLQDNVSQ